MLKNRFTENKMFSDAACVKVASVWAEEAVVKHHYTGPGETARALDLAAKDADIPRGFLREASLPQVGYQAGAVPTTWSRFAVAYTKKRRAGVKSRDPQGRRSCGRISKTGGDVPWNGCGHLSASV